MFTFSCSVRFLLIGMVTISLSACSDGATGTHGHPAVNAVSDSGIDADHTLSVAYILPPEADGARANDSAAWVLSNSGHFILSWDPTDETADNRNYEIFYARTNPDDDKPIENDRRKAFSGKTP